ncbi:MAG: PP2C family protein-serine/threonine phosphatase, partial [Methanobrevibacter sp.]|nr:PP2C family protein-serine/threonine phosphatase [Methanobrevibacter sp.]
VFFLNKLEEDFSFPLESLSKISKKYSESNNKIADASSIISEIHKFENKDNEIGMLSNSFKILIQNLKDYMINLEKFTAERERINTELNIAYNIQSALLRRDFPPYPERKEFDIYAVSFPAKEVGGDFYDFFLIDDDHLAIIIADISGKGVPAAIFMAITKTLIKTLIINNHDLSQVVNMVNNLLCEDNEECMFATALIGVLTISSGEFSFVNAGHNLPLVKNKNNQINEVKANANFVLGGMDDLNYSKDTISLNKGDKLFLYTDGVTEAINQKDEFFGMKRLKSLLNEDLNIKDSLINIKKNITKFEGENNQFDDITMLMLEYDK